MLAVAAIYRTLGSTYGGADPLPVFCLILKIRRKHNDRTL